MKKDLKQIIEKEIDTKGDILWIDDQVVGFKCECGAKEMKKKEKEEIEKLKKLRELSASVSPEVAYLIDKEVKKREKEIIKDSK